MDRRTVLGLGVSALAALSARSLAEDMNAQGVLSTDPTEIVPLWPGTPPGGEGVNLEAKITERSSDTSIYHDRFVTDVGTPLLAVYRPETPDGSAVDPRHVQFAGQIDALVVGIEHALGELDLLVDNLGVRDLLEQVVDAIEPRPPLVICFDDVPT